MILGKKPAVATALSAVCFLAGCSHAPTAVSKGTPPSGIVVVASISTLAALVRAVAGNHVTVQTLVPIGVSPETYEPTPHDIIALENASLVVENGAGLESWLGKLIKNSATRAQVVVLSQGIASAGPQSAALNTQAQNPHFWLDPNYAQLYVARISHALAHVDPAHAAVYRANASAELQRLSNLDRWTRQRIATLSPDQRAMIAFHDAWFYFDRRYGIRDIGAIEPSPGREPSAAELAALIELARANHVRAIFAEPEFSPRLAKQLAEDAGITTVTNLYDDSLGTTPELSTYEGMMHHDVDTIVKALGS